MNIAVFIDFDNIEIGVKSTLGEHFDVGTILDAIKERGEVVTKIAYADWTRAGEYSRHLTQHAIRLVQRNLTPGGDKNGADINLALDALEMAFTHPHINAYVIVGGDSDFLSLVEKLKQYDKKVFVVGGRAFTSVILQRNCHEFISYENLPGARRLPSKGGRPAPASTPSPVAQAIPIVRRALKILADREVSPQTGLLKSTLLQLDSTFSERNYGASSFLDFVGKLEQAGVVQLKHAGRSVMVELNAAFDESSIKSAAPEEPADDGARMAPAEGAGEGAAQSQPQAQATAAGHPVPAAAVITPVGTQADGVRLVGEFLRRATDARWPMYLRNVKQIIRKAEGGFDERRYGFQGLIDLLRACQREGLVRLERDRRGGLRVFQGTALQRAPVPVFDVESLQEEPESDRVQTDGAEPGAAEEPLRVVDADFEEEIGPMPTIDPTAELLGTAKRKRTARTRTPAPATPHAAKKTPPRGTRKTGGRRAKKAEEV
ncbi:MAG TPA: NYN domain-containing protein [Vicinamibacterales bacterium]|nr:NYN domain-containing protein [Vicinamibacterales bacterium]